MSGRDLPPFAAALFGCSLPASLRLAAQAFGGALRGKAVVEDRCE